MTFSPKYSIKVKICGTPPALSRGSIDCWGRNSSNILHGKIRDRSQTKDEG